jgi:hypothetical protein
MMIIDKRCPVCRNSAKYEIVGPTHRQLYRCEFCGCFELPSIAELIFESEDRSLFPYFSAHIRQNGSFQSPFQIDLKNWEQFAKLHKATPVLKKIELLLNLIAQRTDPPGAWVSFTNNDAPLIDAASYAELVYLIQQIEGFGYITLNPTSANCSCMMLASGWERLQERASFGIPGRCFVAMSFDPFLDEAWEKGIDPALRIDCNVDPVRMDKEEHNEKICDKIIAEIRLSQFLVADFTLHRAGVYFEAGYALGLARPVIWMCQEADLKNAHFDTRQYNHIVWTTPEDLRKKLRDRVIATIPRT